MGFPPQVGQPQEGLYCPPEVPGKKESQLCTVATCFILCLYWLLPFPSSESHFPTGPSWDHFPRKVLAFQSLWQNHLLEKPKLRRSPFQRARGRSRALRLSQSEMPAIDWILEPGAAGNSFWQQRPWPSIISSRCQRSKELSVIGR